MGRNAGKSVRYDDDLHARIRVAAEEKGETIAEWCARVAEQALSGARASVTVPGGRARPRPTPQTVASCPHPMSVRVGNTCGRCGVRVR